MKIVYLDGAFLSETEAKISIFDRGFLFGDGVYVTIQVKDGHPLFLSDHLKHLNHAADSFHIDPPSLSSAIIFELISLNHADRGVWKLRIILTGGNSSSNHLPKRDGTLLMYIESFIPSPYKPLKLGIFPYPFSLCHASFKSLAHLNRYYVMEEAKKRGMDDCITTTENGYLLEASFGNLFWIANDTFYTPSSQLPLYSGITLGKMRTIAKRSGYRIEDGKFEIDQISEEAVCFRTNTMSGLCPINQIEKRLFSINDGKTSYFQQEYEKLIEEDAKQLSLILE